MEIDQNQIFDDVTRGEMLLYLARLYPQGATPTMLLHYLADRGIRIHERSRLVFHVHYLAEAGLVSFEEFQSELGPAELRLIKSTKAGLDRVEGRPAGSSGVRL